MLKFLIGPVLTGAGYIAGSVYGRDVEQVVHKSPDATYDGIRDAVSNVPAVGTTSFDGGAPQAYDLKSEEVADHHLQLTLRFAGQVGATADIQVSPGGADDQALVTAKFHGERAVLQQALAGTDKARLAYAPDWILNLAAKPLLRQLGSAIEKGERPMLGGGDARAQWEAHLTPAERNHVAEWQQYHATEPMVDLSKPSGQN